MVPNYGYLRSICRISSGAINQSGEINTIREVEVLLELPEFFDRICQIGQINGKEKEDGEKEEEEEEEEEEDEDYDEDDEAWSNNNNYNGDDDENGRNHKDLIATTKRDIKRHKKPIKVFYSPHPPSPSSKRSQVMHSSPKNNPKTKFIFPKVR